MFGLSFVSFFHSEEIPSIQKATSYLGIQEVIANCTQNDPVSSTLPAESEFIDPRSPLSPDDYEPLEPIEEVEERQRLMELEKNAAPPDPPTPPDESHSSGELTARGSEKRIRKPKTRLYEDDDFSRKESPVSQRGRGRGRGRPRGRPRTVSSGSDKTDLIGADKSPSAGGEVVRGRGRGRGRHPSRGRPRAGPEASENAANEESENVLSRGSGRPRGRPRTRPLTSEAADSTSAEESAAHGNDEMEQVELKNESAPDNPDDTENRTELQDEAAAENEDRIKSEEENVKEGTVAKRGRGRPRIKPTVDSINSEVSNVTEIKEREEIVRKKGRPRSIDPLPEFLESEIPEEEREDGHDQENRKTQVSSSETADEANAKDLDVDFSAPLIKKVRTSNRKRCLSRKLRESQASNEENDPADGGDDGGVEEWPGEEDDDDDDIDDIDDDDEGGEVGVLDSKHRPICNICGNLFSEMSSLRRHMRIHKGIKPYQCQLCNRCFRQGNQLKTHMRIHTGRSLAVSLGARRPRVLF